MAMERYLETDETNEAVSALEMVAAIGPSIPRNIYEWKWAIIAMHNALQGFMVLALRGSNGLLALKDKIALKWLEAYYGGEEYPTERLDIFLNLYEKIKSDVMLFTTKSHKFVPNKTQDDSVKQLNSLRNNFIHFIPKSWLLEVSGLPDIFWDCLEIIRFLGWECGNILWHEREIKERAEVAFHETTEIIQRIKKDYSD